MNTKNNDVQYKFVTLIIVGVLYSIGLAYFFQSLPTARFTSDFFPRWHASRMLLTEGRSIYDWTNATEISAVTGWPHLNQLGYYYPAYLLIFTAPLALLPFGTAQVIWTIFGLWSLWLSMAIMVQILPPPLSLNRLTLLLILVTISVPVFQHSLYAQFNSLGVLALALAYRAVYRQRYLAAGLWAGGLLFKPQATLIPLLILLIWTLWRRERWYFWLGLGLISGVLWSLAEWLEPHWVIAFLQSLDNYVPIASIIDQLWNPYQFVTLTLLGLTLWFVYRLRHAPAMSVEFGGLLIWTINLNALLVPMFGMMHMVSMGLVFIILWKNFARRYPGWAAWVWGGIIGLLILGLLSFIIPMILVGPTGLQITITEMVYRFALPMILGIAALPLMFNLPAYLRIPSRQIVT